MQLDHGCGNKHEVRSCSGARKCSTFLVTKLAEPGRAHHLSPSRYERPPEAPIYGCPRFWGFESPKSAQSLSEFWGFQGPRQKICPRLVHFWGFETDLGRFGPSPWTQNKSKIKLQCTSYTRYHPPNFKQQPSNYLQTLWTRSSRFGAPVSSLKTLIASSAPPSTKAARGGRGRGARSRGVYARERGADLTRAKKQKRG